MSINTRRTSAKDIARIREWKRRNPEKMKAYREKARDWQREYNKRRALLRPHEKRTQALRKYNLTIGDYERMLARQGGVCAICMEPPPTTIRTWTAPSASP